MKRHDKFYLATIITVSATRTFVYLMPIASPTVSGFRIHHWMYGLAGVILCTLLRKRFKSVVLLGSSLGVFLDEAGYILINGKTHADNYSPKSFILIMLFEVLLFVFRKPITNLYMNGTVKDN